MQRLIFFTHIVSVSVYLGATLLLAILLGPVGRPAADARERRRRYAAVFRVYNPLSIGALGVVVMTGAWSLTPYKEALGSGYFSTIGSPLAAKLALAFLLILLATYVSFGICHRIVRADQSQTAVTHADLDSLLRRLHLALWLTMGVCLFTFWVAVGLVPPALAP